MKNFLFLLICFISFSCFSQVKIENEIKISKAKLAAANSVKDFVADISKDCLITSFECSANTKDGIATVTNNSDDLNTVTKTILESLTLKNKFYISNFKCNCSTLLKKEYGFVITE